MSLSKFKASNEIKTRGSYKPQVKAKLNSHLLLEEDNIVKLKNLLDNGAPGVVEMSWDLSNEDHIINRDKFIQENGLDIDSDDVRCKWSIRQSTKTLIVKQCICGSYRDKMVASGSRISAARYPYVECLAFASIFLRNNEICGIAGYLNYSEQCVTSQPQRDPPYRLLPYVRKSVENLLNLNVKTPDILAQNARIVKNVFGNRTLIGNFRTLLTATDITNIKKQVLRNSWNIDIKYDAAKNLDHLLGPDADQSELKEACLHYQPHTNETDRLEIIICTPEQQEYAWKYGHQNLILVDGTFGISKHKLLLFIIMVIDENNKGIPVAFILFTPPQYNRLTSSGYDSKILEKLFIIFRDKISNNYNKNNPLSTSVTFTPLVAMTDTDVKERKPLSKVWPGIILLLCYFHISQCCKNEINKQLGRGGENKVILLRQTLKAFLKSVLEEARSIDGSEEIVRNYIKGKKESLERIYKLENKLENKKILEGGLKFFTYFTKQWAGDLLYSWCLNGRTNAAKVLGIPLEKLPTTNNHLEGMNEYLKNNQLNRFQRNNHLLRADVLYIALVYEVIPNILTLRNLAANLELEKVERQKEFNIIDPADRKILLQEFPQIAYLSPSAKRDESARRILNMNKIIKYEVEELTGKIHVEVESETTPGFVYTTCVYGQPTDICCQCFDFLQKGILCKHLRAAALYIEELRKQERYSYLPEMNFPTYQEAQNIRHNPYANKHEIPVSSEDDDIIEDDEIDNNNEDTDYEINNEINNNNINSSITTSSKEVLNYIGHVLGLNISTEMSSSRTPEPSQLRSNIVDVSNLNAIAIYQQELGEFLESTSKSLQTLQNNLIFLQNLVNSEQSPAQKNFSISDQNILLTHLRNVITSISFKEVQNRISIIHEEIKPHRRITPNTSILPLEKEKKQQRKQSYKVE